MLEFDPNITIEITTGVWEDSWPEYPQVAGASISWPFFDIVETTPIYQPLPIPNASEVFHFHNEMEDLFVNNPLPAGWEEYLQEILPQRQASGGKCPIDLVAAAGFTIEENLELANSLGLSSLDIDTFESKQQIVDQINGILTNSELKTYMTNQLILQIPDYGGYVNDHKAEQVLAKMDLEGKICVDLGCGTGENTEDLANQYNMDTVGFDRQIHPKYYSVWQLPDRSAAFTLGDVRNETIIPENSARVVRIRNVAHHISADALEQIILEGARILEPDNGIMLIGPVGYDERGDEKPTDGEWRFFKKVNCQDGNYLLQRVHYTDLVPDAKY